MSGAGHYPRLARRLIRWALPEDRRDDITGDLDEVFRRRCHERGRVRALLWYWREALMFSTRFLAERLREGANERAGTGGPAGSDGRARPGITKLGRLSFGISWLDLKLGVRMLFKYPGLTLVGTLAMSVAIATVAGFHAFTQALVDPKLPVPDGDRVVALWNADLGTGGRGEQTLGDMLTWRESLGSIEDVGGFTTRQRVVVAGEGQARSVRAAQISPSAFRMLRVSPVLGRLLVADDERPGGPAVALLGFDLWQSG
ncbi:MAG: permease prefix domain 2-containing transporter, partial [Longimicrobiales bacterium]